MPKIHTMPNSPLEEIYQQKNVRFAFANLNDDSSITQCHPFVKCRDFLNDVLITNDTRKDIFPIFKFSYDYEKFVLTSPVLLIKCTNPVTVRKGVPLIHYFEENGKINGRTKFEWCDEEKILICYFPHEWADSTYLISIYTMLLRLLSYGYKKSTPVEDFLKKVSEKEDNDSKYIRKILKSGLDLISLIKFRNELMNGATIYGSKKDYPLSKQTAYTVHDNSGLQQLVALYTNASIEKNINCVVIENYKKIVNKEG